MKETYVYMKLLVECLGAVAPSTSHVDLPLDTYKVYISKSTLYTSAYGIEDN